MTHKQYLLKPEAAMAHVSWLQPHVDAKLLNREYAVWKTSSSGRIAWKKLIKEEFLDDLTAVLTIAQEAKRLTYHQASLQLLHDLINGFAALCRKIKEEKSHA